MKRLKRLLPALAFAACVTVLLSVAAGAATPRELADEYCYHTRAAWCLDKDGDGVRESAPQLHPRFTEQGIEHLRERNRYYDPNDVEPEPDPTPTPTPTPTATPLPPTTETATGLLSEDKTKRTRGKATLVMPVNYNKHWYYKADRPPHDACSDVEQAGSFEVELTGLAAGTKYTYTAHGESDTGCTGSPIGSVTFTTAVVAGNTTLGSNLAGWPVNRDRQLANSFTTGSHAAGYDLKQIIGKFREHNGNPDPIRAAIHAASGSDPGSLLMTLNNVDGDPKPNQTQHIFHFRCASTSCYLDGGTTYFVVFSIPNTTLDTGNDYRWQYTNEDGEQLDPAGNGWSLGNVMRESTNGGSSWSDNTSGHAGRFDVVAFPR